MRALVVGVAVLLMGCAEYPGDFGVSSELISPEMIVDGEIPIAGVDVLFQINAKVRCAGSEAVSVCIVAEPKQWCGGAACIPGQYVNAVLNFASNDLPIRPSRAYLSGGYNACAGVWLVAIR